MLRAEGGVVMLRKNRIIGTFTDQHSISGLRPERFASPHLCVVHSSGSGRERQVSHDHFLASVCVGITCFLPSLAGGHKQIHFYFFLLLQIRGL